MIIQRAVGIVHRNDTTGVVGIVEWVGTVSKTLHLACRTLEVNIDDESLVEKVDGGIGYGCEQCGAVAYSVALLVVVAY